MATSSEGPKGPGAPLDEFVSMGEAIVAAGGDWGALKRELQRRGYHELAKSIDAPEEPLPEPERCERCGGVKDEEHPAFDRGACRCGGRSRRLLSYLDAVDPDRRMTLDTAERDNESVQEALGKICAILEGTRERGLFLLGLPGRGKTHLMVGLGRALLERDRDAGYYNVARLVSRIQASYSAKDGDRETRRAIVEGVASHEVVLLDDLGKEHSSPDAQSIVYELVDSLYVAGRTLVVSTNVPTKKTEGYDGPILGERYDEAVRSRLKAMCERLPLKGEDRRVSAWEW